VEELRAELHERSCAVSHPQQGIRVNVVAPGPILTPLIPATMAARPQLERSAIAPTVVTLTVGSKFWPN
jgi:NAD(P)-dependent dehydrogenase (short-subunit alcohol dehydrogenase family)